MGSRYLTDLADVCRQAGLAVVEYQGWPTRARGSGGYNPGCPTHVMVHHTASGASWDGQRDADYIATGSPDAPLSNLYLDRSGCCWVLAAGATNTNGQGADWWGGGVPANSMNSYAIGIEAGNDGVGETWPPAQLDAYRRVVAALCARYGITYSHVRGHFEWAQGRKIDPAGNSPYATGGASWDMDRFRADCAAAAGTTPPPIGDDMPAQIIKGDATETYWAWNGVHLAGIPSLEWAQWGFEAGLYQSPEPTLYPQSFVDQLVEHQAG